MPGVGRTTKNAILHLGPWNMVSMVFAKYTKHEKGVLDTIILKKNAILHLGPWKLVSMVFSMYTKMKENKKKIRYPALVPLNG